jgi:urease alpha subunit
MKEIDALPRSEGDPDYCPVRVQDAVIESAPVDVLPLTPRYF